MIANGLATGWEEWHEHDAVALADLVRAGKVTAKELCAQAAAAVGWIDPQIEAVLSLFEDVMPIWTRIGRARTAGSTECRCF